MSELNNFSELKKTIDEIHRDTLVMSVCETIAHKESDHAVRIILATMVGALLKKGELELAEKVIGFLEQV